MKKIIFSLAIIAAAAAVVIGGTTAYFSDTETSNNNTFTAGSIDLKVDNTCTYNGIACPNMKDPAGNDLVLNWAATDLGASHKFFYFTDVKPGDYGEDTISLHVDSNDACGFVKITKPAANDTDVSCPEPEMAVETACAPTSDGELDENTIFSIWSDMGTSQSTNGDCANVVPGDNKYSPNCGDILLTQGTLDEVENWGLGKLSNATTYYYGISWTVPTTVGNEVQTDSFTGDVEFNVIQSRNYNNGICPVGEMLKT
jgi:predicted ribosomally synthesized peptide with SipW-like signal peptide